jgi:hypothetical protein
MALAYTLSCTKNLLNPHKASARESSQYAPCSNRLKRPWYINLRSTKAALAYQRRTESTQSLPGNEACFQTPEPHKSQSYSMPKRGGSLGNSASSIHVPIVTVVRRSSVTGDAAPSYSTPSRYKSPTLLPCLVISAIVTHSALIQRDKASYG